MWVAKCQYPNGLRILTVANAAVGNINLPAISFYEELARAVQGRPDASRHDLMMSPYDLFGGARTEANRMSGVVGS